MLKYRVKLVFSKHDDYLLEVLAKNPKDAIAVTISQAKQSGFTSSVQKASAIEIRGMGLFANNEIF